jgi:2-methylcitrate dehydratase PrpD
VIESITATAARWLHALKLEDIPGDVVAHAKLRALDVIGCALAAGSLKYGGVIETAVAALGSPGASRMIGSAHCVAPVWAAFGNGALAHALIFDDTHNETIIHPSGPVGGTALALADGVSGKEFLTTFIAGTELTCRIGLAAVGQFHKSGFQPTAIVAPLGAALAASRLLRLSEAQTVHAAGNCGSFASGIVESWADGTWTQLLHPGWAAHSGIAAAVLARAGWSGPATVVEGRFGLFRSHVQQPDYAFAFERVTEDLGGRWESRGVSFKPYPCAHVLHPFLDAVLALHRDGLRAQDVARIECPIARYMLPVVCEPVAEKKRPASDAQARTSLHYSVAEALATGRLDVSSYSDAALADPRILALADRVDYTVDESAPGTRHYKGWVIAHTSDGRRLEKIEPINRGNPDYPMRDDEVIAKFRVNAGTRLDERQARRIEEFVTHIETRENAGQLLDACARGA